MSHEPFSLFHHSVLIAMAVCQAHRGLPVGFLFLRYSVLFTVESFIFALSPCYSLIYMF